MNNWLEISFMPLVACAFCLIAVVARIFIHDFWIAKFEITKSSMSFRSAALNQIGKSFIYFRQNNFVFRKHWPQWLTISLLLTQITFLLMGDSPELKTVQVPAIFISLQLMVYANFVISGFLSTNETTKIFHTKSVEKATLSLFSTIVLSISVFLVSKGHSISGVSAPHLLAFCSPLHVPAFLVLLTATESFKRIVIIESGAPIYQNLQLKLLELSWILFLVALFWSQPKHLSGHIFEYLLKSILMLALIDLIREMIPRFHSLRLQGVLTKYYSITCIGIAILNFLWAWYL